MGKIDKLTPFDCILCTTGATCGGDVYRSLSLGVEVSRHAGLGNTLNKQVRRGAEMSIVRYRLAWKMVGTQAWAMLSTNKCDGERRYLSFVIAWRGRWSARKLGQYSQQTGATGSEYVYRSLSLGVEDGRHAGLGNALGKEN